MQSGGPVIREWWLSEGEDASWGMEGMWATRRPHGGFVSKSHLFKVLHLISPTLFLSYFSGPGVNPSTSFGWSDQFGSCASFLNGVGFAAVDAPCASSSALPAKSLARCIACEGRRLALPEHRSALQISYPMVCTNPLPSHTNHSRKARGGGLMLAPHIASHCKINGTKFTIS